MNGKKKTFVGVGVIAAVAVGIMAQWIPELAEFLIGVCSYAE